MDIQAPELSRRLHRITGLKARAAVLSLNDELQPVIIVDDVRPPTIGQEETIRSVAVSAFVAAGAGVNAHLWLSNNYGQQTGTIGGTPRILRLQSLQIATPVFARFRIGFRDASINLGAVANTSYMNRQYVGTAVDAPSDNDFFTSVGTSAAASIVTGVLFEFGIRDQLTPCGLWPGGSIVLTPGAGFAISCQAPNQDAYYNMIWTEEPVGQS